MEIIAGFSFDRLDSVLKIGEIVGLCRVVFSAVSGVGNSSGSLSGSSSLFRFVGSSVV